LSADRGADWRPQAAWNGATEGVVVLFGLFQFEVVLVPAVTIGSIAPARHEKVTQEPAKGRASKQP
jgi:hypothetical protein